MSDQTAFPPPDAPGGPPGWDQGRGAPPPSLHKGPPSLHEDPVPQAWGGPPPAWSAPPGPGTPAPGWGGAPRGGGMPPLVAKPGVVPLRPLTLGEIYDGSFQAMRRNPAAMMGSAALVVTVITVISSVLQYLLGDSLAVFASLDPTATPTDSELASGAGALGLFGIGSTVLQLIGISLLTGILVTALSQAVLGKRPSFGEVWRAARPRILPLAGLTLLLVVGYFVFSLAVFVPGIVLLAVAGPVGVVLLLLGVLAWIAGLLFLFVRVGLAAPALVLEQTGVFASLARGWRLTRGSFWRCLGILLLGGLIAGLATGALTVPGVLLSSVYGAANPDDPLAAAGFAPVQLVITGVASIIGSTIVYPFWAGVTSLLYIDLRMRREGLDVELARAARR